MERRADGFQNYLKATYKIPSEKLLVDRAQLLTRLRLKWLFWLVVCGFTGANYGNASHGVFTNRIEVKAMAFTNLLDMNVNGTIADASNPYPETLFEGRDRQSGALKWTATRTRRSSVRIRDCAPIAETYAKPIRKRNLLLISRQHGLRLWNWIADLEHSYQ